ncbi:MAG: hypothetical protein AABX03_02250 [Nanoarchaeota archaeon]
MKKRVLIYILILILIVIGLVIIFPKTQNTKNSEEEIMVFASNLYQAKKAQGMNYSSQCLGTISINNISYVIDIVNVPRTKEDNLQENQCQDYLNGNVKHFIELDKNGQLVRIV